VVEKEEKKHLFKSFFTPHLYISFPAHYAQQDVRPPIPYFYRTNPSFQIKLDYYLIEEPRESSQNSKRE